MNVMSSRGKRSLTSAGFTIVELLIVIVVIAILAALVIIGYNGVTRSAHEASIVSDVRQGGSKLEQSKIVNSQYPTDCNSAGIQVSPDNILKCTVNANRTGFCLSVSYDDMEYFTSNQNLTPRPGTCSGSNGIADGGGYAAVVATYNSSCALSNANKIFCWGSNNYGQLGNGNTTASNSPVATNMTGVLAGRTIESLGENSWSYFHYCIIASSAPYCWGNNLDGQLGNNSSTSSSNPVAVSMSGVLAGRSVQKVSVGGYHSCAVSDGAAFCWGGNNNGQLGNGTTTGSTVPVAVSTAGVLAGRTVTDISAGPTYTCAIADGAPYCWGYDASNGVFGNNTSDVTSTVPVATTTSGVLSGRTVTEIGAGEYHVCVLADGAPYCWGRNTNGELGTGNFTSSLVPVATTTSGVLSGKTITHLTTGAYANCVIADSAPYCWGDNGIGGIGTLGNGATTDSNVPVAVVMTGVLSGVAVTRVDAGLYHMCAYGDGAAYCWGSGTVGQLGNGVSSTSTVPVLALPALP